MGIAQMVSFTALLVISFLIIFKLKLKSGFSRLIILFSIVLMAITMQTKSFMFVSFDSGYGVLLSNVAFFSGIVMLFKFVLSSVRLNEGEKEE